MSGFSGEIKVGNKYILISGERIKIQYKFDGDKPENDRIGYIVNDVDRWESSYDALYKMIGLDLTDTKLSLPGDEEDNIISDLGIAAQDNPIKPSHYKLSGGREAIDIIKEILTPEQFIGFLRGNIFKYDIRYKQKGGVEDLKKAEWYKTKLIEVESGNV